MDITAVADPAFSSKMMGDGFAIELTEGEVVAPFDAEVTAAFPTGHAYGLRRKDGVELEAVKAKGKSLVTPVIFPSGAAFTMNKKDGIVAKAEENILKFS